MFSAYLPPLSLYFPLQPSRRLTLRSALEASMSVLAIINATMTTMMAAASTGIDTVIAMAGDSVESYGKLACIRKS